jgi:transposase
MARPLLDDELWNLIEPLLPPPKPRRFKYPGRKPLDRRKVLTGILFVLKTGIPWEDLPQEMGCGCGMSCWRYLTAWQQAGVWDKVHKALLDRLRAEEAIDLSAAVVDSSHVRAVGGANVPVPAPWIAGKMGRSITSSRMRRAFRWPFGSRVPTATMSRS